MKTSIGLSAFKFFVTSDEVHLSCNENEQLVFYIKKLQVWSLVLTVACVSATEEGSVREITPLALED